MVKACTAIGVEELPEKRLPSSLPAALPVGSTGTSQAEEDAGRCFLPRLCRTGGGGEVGHEPELKADLAR